MAQIVALTTWGNVALRAPALADADFYPGNSTFEFYEYVRFIDVAAKEGRSTRTYADVHATDRQGSTAHDHR